MAPADQRYAMPAGRAAAPWAAPSAPDRAAGSLDRASALDRADFLLRDAATTNADSEAVSGATLVQMQTQGEQLRGARTTVQETRQTVKEAKGVLNLMARKILKEKLWLYAIALGLAGVDVALAYRLATNGGSLGARR
ncbi:hypothetical protein M885DRAFT_509949 [Pelagophyceae sp. CCMP2097]|nr:hypothetical protein M885DRAFT_509949 [Pelagophyceae sp. CCMP2097]